MASFHFDLVSPERLLLSEDAEMVTIPGMEGEMGVMAGHMPLITALRPGTVDVKGGSQGVHFHLLNLFAHGSAVGYRRGARGGCTKRITTSPCA